MNRRVFWALVARLIVFQLLLSSMALAAVEPIYGPEWTFTNSAVFSGAGDAAQILNVQRVMDQIQNYCQRTGVCYLEPKEWKIIFPGKFVVTVSRDPSVIELQATPMTLSQWKSHEKLIQEAIFDNFALLDLKPHEREGAGHVNIGLAAFQENPLLLRNFIVDFFNHEGVGVALNSIMANSEDAPYLSQLNTISEKRIRVGLKEIDENPQAKFLQVVQAFTFEMSRKFIALAIRDVEYRYQWKDGLRSAELQPGFLKPSSRLEVRSLRPQASMKDFIKVLEIFDARIRYLEKQKRALPLKTVNPIEDGWIALGQFADYLKESGLELKKYKSLLPELWRQLPESNYIRNWQPRAPVCSRIYGI